MKTFSLSNLGLPFFCFSFLFIDEDMVSLIESQPSIIIVPLIIVIFTFAVILEV